MAYTRIFVIFVQNGLNRAMVGQRIEFGTQQNLIGCVARTPSPPIAAPKWLSKLGGYVQFDPIWLIPEFL